MKTDTIKTASKKYFQEHVVPEEIEEIKRRRKTVGLETESLDDGLPVDRNIVGLAISGGGIRSATFSLGVVQEFARQGTLKRVDYLSTVSGGGYTGSCLSSLLNDPEHKSGGDEFPLKYTAGAGEPPSLTHLRNSSNYLIPGGLFNKLRLPVMLLRGILLNLFIFMPFIMVAVYITEIAYEHGPHWATLTSLLLPLSFVFLLMAITLPVAMRLFRRRFDWAKRNTYELWMTVPLLLVAIILLLLPILALIQLAIEHTTGQFLTWFNQQSAFTLWISGILAAGVAILFMMAAKAPGNIAKWSVKLLLAMLGFLGPAFVFLIYLALCLWQIDSPYLPVSFTTVLNEAVECDKPCLYQKAQQHKALGIKKSRMDEFTGLLFQSKDRYNTFPELLDELRGRSISPSESAIVRCQSSNCTDAFNAGNWRLDNRVWVINNAPHIQEYCPPLESGGSTIKAGSTGNCHYLKRASNRQLRIESDRMQFFDRSEDPLFAILFVAMLLFNRFFLDMNITSLHGFYRDRLSKAYLFKLDSENEVVHVDKTKLSSLNAENSTAPYHLINVALNLQGSTAADLRGRKSDLFMLSKHFIGSDRTGYAATREIEKYDKYLDLGTAMAISGAAAAPNMGTDTNRSLVFLMTLLNIRLGYWLPNPKLVNSKRWFKWFSLSGVKPTLIWREALGKLDAKGSHVNVSDGGHIENMGIYPLLKRNCKYIVAIDGEADPDMTFGGLLKLTRYARIDMGIDIEMKLDSIRKDQFGNSKSHWVTGDIHYGSGEKGKLLYIKLSVTGDEPEYVRAYRSRFPRFPHEPTSDQFFTEEQFEAYRALGCYACRKMFENKDALGEFAGIGSTASEPGG